MKDLIAVYEAGDEDGRLAKSRNWVEWERTCEVLRRWLPGPPGRLLDVGGASGRYASWLSGLGYTMHVVDPVPRHVAQARAAARASEHLAPHLSLHLLARGGVG